jgi:hypothetical protein
MDAALELAQKVPQPVQYGLAGVGALFLTTKLFGFFRLLLSAFVLGGTNVRHKGTCKLEETLHGLTKTTASKIWKAWDVGCDHGCLGWPG